MVCGGRDEQNSRRVGTARGETEDMAGETWFWWVQRGVVWSKRGRNGSVVGCASGCIWRNERHSNTPTGVVLSTGMARISNYIIYEDC